MHFPRYWTTAKQGKLSAWGWSDESPAQAEAVASTRLSRIAEWLTRNNRQPAQRYGYPGQPMREEVLREFRAPNGTLHGVVTRNSYGCIVLNTANLMFVDVDAPEANESSFLAGLFGFRRPDRNRRPEDFPKKVTGRVEQWIATRPDWGWRVYRTCAGIRLLATQQPITPDDSACKEAFDTFEADPLYRRLCASQKCFRARLTPKPWRCGTEKPRGRWPWLNEQTEARFRQWETRYLAAAKDHATCSLIGQFGRAEIHPAFRELVEFHDNTAQAGSGLPLA